MIAVPALGADTLADLESAAANSVGHKMLAGWCRETGFAYLIELQDGEPQAWRFTGPLSRADAHALLTGSFTRLQ